MSASIELSNGDKITVSKWRREGDDSIRGIKVSLSDKQHVVTAFLSINDCEKFMVALFREKKAVKEDLDNWMKLQKIEVQVEGGGTENKSDEKFEEVSVRTNNN